MFSCLFDWCLMVFDRFLMFGLIKKLWFLLACLIMFWAASECENHHKSLKTLSVFECFSWLSHLNNMVCLDEISYKIDLKLTSNFELCWSSKIIKGWSNVCPTLIKIHPKMIKHCELLMRHYQTWQRGAKLSQLGVILGQVGAILKQLVANLEPTWRNDPLQLGNDPLQLAKNRASRGGEGVPRYMRA